ncbi:hypothetical protein [Neosynechococcus sphagnicola]|uniref:hypothetical protein n=1 Tax=Neosynechococcus sphagnicola TaxID=1501145 RepID=UPI0012E0478D|nr:hypothetical protein [Neosynechococcus sphagnicola]
MADHGRINREELFYPSENYVLVYRSAGKPDRFLKSSDTLEGEEVVFDFTLSVADLFQDTFKEGRVLYAADHAKEAGWQPFC